jgi:hypothetical protein
MRKRTLLIAMPICVVVLAAGVAFAAPGGGEHARDARLDNPHAVRPTAASPVASYPVALEFFGHALERVPEYVQAVQLQEIAAFVESVIAEENARAEAEAAAAARAAAEAAAARQVVRSAPSSSVNGGFLACVKQRESGGNYGIHNSQGSGASGAYQFMPSTWNSIAQSTGRSDLVGIDPAAAAPSDQDAMAVALYQQQGAAPWGGGC